MKHSEGPWTAEGPDEFGDYNIHEPGIRAVVAAVISNLRDPAEIEANARLVAAGPELLAALEEIIARNEIQHWFNLDQARAAVAKAKQLSDT